MLAIDCSRSATIINGNEEKREPRRGINHVERRVTGKIARREHVN